MLELCGEWSGCVCVCVFWEVGGLMCVCVCVGVEREQSQAKGGI